MGPGDSLPPIFFEISKNLLVFCPPTRLVRRDKVYLPGGRGRSGRELSISKPLAESDGISGQRARRVCNRRSVNFRGMRWLGFNNGIIVEGSDSWNLDRLLDAGKGIRYRTNQGGRHENPQFTAPTCYSVLGHHRCNQPSDRAPIVNCNVCSGRDAEAQSVEGFLRNRHEAGNSKDTCRVA